MNDTRQRAQRGLVTLRDRSTRLLDTYVPPDRRNDLMTQLQTWASTHPKLATLIALHTILSLPPILLFALFATSTLLTTLLITLSTALFLALTTTLFLASLAFFLLLLPTLLLMTTIATTLFLIAIVTSTTAHWFGNDPRTKGVREAVRRNATALGEKVRDVTDGAVDPTVAARKIGSVGSSAVQGLAVYGEELGKMRGGNGSGSGAINNSNANANGNGSPGLSAEELKAVQESVALRAKGSNSQLDGADEREVKERNDLARQVFGVPAASAQGQGQGHGQVGEETSPAEEARALRGRLGDE